MKHLIKKLNVSHYFSHLRKDRKVRDVFVGVSIAALIAGNVLLSPVALKLDFSRGQAYSLSPASLKVLRDLKESVEITFYVSQDLPSKLLPVKSQVRDLLDEYRRSSSKISIKTVDPKTDTTAAQAAMNAGIMPIEFSQLEMDKFAVTQGYFGLAIKINDQTVAIPQIDPTTLEYTITSGIYKATRGAGTKIAFSGAAGSIMDIFSQQMSPDSAATLQRVLNQQFEVELSNLEEIDEAIKTAIVIDSADNPLSEKAAQGLRTYLSKGGKAIILASGVHVSEQLTTSSPSAHLKPILEEYGVTIQGDLVLSAQSELVNFGENPNVQTIVQYPAWIRTNVFNPDASYVSNVGSLSYPWASPISFTKKAGITQRDIVRTTKNSWVQKGPDFKLRPQEIPRPAQKDIKQSVVTAYAQNTQNKSEVLVISTSKFVNDRYLARNSGNIEFVLNMVNEFSSGGALSGIRSRKVDVLPIPDLSGAQKDFFKWANVLLLPGLFAVYGALRLYNRSQEG
jgi:ABC-type uncharacterized transport system involved in gliding motility auxiliary subunit